ncbi:hypothetical protein M2277_005094 [Paenibacillus sp. LBL]|uniref:hypothetical protein n=1 Tax=Paenibacillus sp. LBL TaxID=2940563 RepID=UPI002473F7F3|nr:hypothetical protein [Paenibacillus sp. LBL]MDH6674402.1 hypothetical protein [Paenibacillus sp. LBL]
MDQIDKKIIKLVEQGKTTQYIMAKLGVTEHKVKTVRKSSMAAPPGSFKDICLRIANSLIKEGLDAEIVSDSDSLHQLVVNGMKIIVKTASPHKVGIFKFKMTRNMNNRELREGETALSKKVVGTDYSKICDYVIFVGKDQKSRNEVDFYYWMIPSDQLPVNTHNFSLNLSSKKYEQYVVRL